MKTMQALITATCSFLLPLIAYAQSSSSCGPSPSNGIQPSLASGYSMQVVATGLNKPRGILLDQVGNLLVVESGSGIVSAHTLNEQNGCVSITGSSNVTSALALNHGIEMSGDGKTLYASSTDQVFSWAYDSSSRTVSGRQTIVGNMSGSDHTTRTLLLSKKTPGLLVVARGSTSNIDIAAADIDSGLSQVKAFNLNNRTGTYSYDVDGLRLGWGLRNEVGVGEHPNSGGIYGVENSADEITRMGVDIHENNPGEELNFLGYLNGTGDANQGKNFGYPWCFSAWGVQELPNNSNLSVGSQFAIDASTASNNQNKTDQFCAEQVQARLVFQAHMAPLDIKFNNSGTEAWITFHGSWDRDVPVGYKMSVVGFNSNGDPVDDITSTTAATDIFGNQDLSKCPNNCFRPVGMAIDSQGRIFVSSDASGEVYLITRTDKSGKPAAGTATSSGSTPSSTSSSTSSSTVSSTVSSTSAKASATNAASALQLPSERSFCAYVASLLALLALA